MAVRGTGQIGLVGLLVWVLTAAVPPPLSALCDTPHQPSASQPSTPTQPAGAANATAPPVNVVIYLVDTLRADHLNVYGYRAHKTSPRIDALAAQGVLFEHGVAAAPWTLPSTASLFTSAYPIEHRVLSTFHRLPDSWDTLPEMLQGLGYRTHAQYATGFLSHEFGLQQGFDTPRRQGIVDGATVARQLGTGTPEPFFFYIHTVEPHNPYRYAPPSTPGFDSYPRGTRDRMHKDMFRYKQAGERDYRAKLPLGTTDLTEAQDAALAPLRELKDAWFELYAASVHYADRNLGSVIDTLEARGVWDNTLFILIADHGEEFDERGGWLHDQSVYEELMHVPFIIRFPNNQFAGKRIRGVASLLDVLPTVLDYLDHSELALNARGRSLMPLIRGALPDRYERMTIPGMRINLTRYYRPWEETRGRTNVIVRQGPWKGVWNVELDTFELYNLDKDPAEQCDAADRCPEIVTIMREFAATWYESVVGVDVADEPDSSGTLSDTTRAVLQALGYIDSDNVGSDSDASDTDIDASDPDAEPSIAR